MSDDRAAQAARAARAHAIFSRAFGLERSEREAMVARECGDDAILRAKVNRLLQAADRSEGFLETPALASVPEPIAEVPDAVGDYLVIGVLGVGGMATVYEAVQESPNRRVALKVMHQTMTHTDALLRFRLETQTLARLRHPGIAQIYEAGTAPIGQATPAPFFAMELIPEARSITAYADHHGLPLRDRLEMFAGVCDAVLHGHQNGIIHRDLKPANVLVGPDGRAKVIDFGIARSREVGTPALTEATDARRLIGTLHSMSPEQCIDPAGIDVRADVYSLGVILYELVTGTPPHDLSRCSIPQAVRIIAEQAAVRAGALRAEAAGDLEAIIAMAMEKDRARRYLGAGALAADIRRYLANRPIEARASTPLEQVGKFARRNPPLAAAIGAALVLLIAGVVVSASFAYLAARARDEAIEGRRELEIVSAFQESMLSGIDAWAMGDKLRASLGEAVMKSMGAEAPAADGLVSDAPSEWTRLASRVNFTTLAVRSLNESILQRAHRSIDEQFAEQPLLRARLLHRLALTMSGLGLHADAEPISRSALSIRRELLGPDHEDAIASLAALGANLSMLGRFDDAIDCLTEAEERSRRASGAFDARTLRSASTLAGVHRRKGDLDEAERLWTRTLADQRRELGDDDPDTLRTLNNIGLVHAAQGRFDKAEACWREVVERRRRIHGENHPEYRGSLGNLGLLLADLGRRDEARPLLEQSLEVDRRRLGDRHPSTLVSMVQLASLLQDSGDLDGAEALQRECVTGRRAALGPEHPDTLRATVFLATIRQLRGERTDAEAMMRECLAVQQRDLGEDHIDTLDSLSALRDLLKNDKRIDEALAISANLLERTRRAKKPNPFDIGRHLSSHGELLAAAGRATDAREALQEGHDLLLRAVGSEHSETQAAAKRITEFEETTKQSELGANPAPTPRSP